jgi:opacity protein-like surface antigen
MQNKLAAAALAAALATGSSALAAGLSTGSAGLKDGPAWVPASIIEANNQIAIQFAATNFDYTETGDPARGLSGTLDTERNWVPGVSVELSLMRDWIVSNFYFNARYTYLGGTTDYRGERVFDAYEYPTEYGSVSLKNGAAVNDFDFRLGKGFEVQPNLMVTPYLGVGYHDWQRKVNDGEEYSNGYVGGGMLVQWAPASGFVLSAHGLIGSAFGSYIDVLGSYHPASVMATIGGVFSGPLGDSAIYRVGLSADYALTRTIHLNAGVEWVDYKYGESAIYDGWYEPDSSTSNTTVRVGLGYAFGAGGTPLK